MTTPYIRTSRASLGISITIIGGLCFAIQDAGIKWLTAEIAVLQVLFLRSLFGLVFLGASSFVSGEQENTGTMLFYTLSSFVFILLVPQYRVWSTLNLNEYLLVTAVAFFGVAAQFSVTRAYAIASPSLIAPFEYTALVWSAAMRYLVWGDIPDIYALTGAVLIIGSGVYIIHRETYKRVAE